MSAATSLALRRYVRWAASQTGLPADEIMVLTLDRALGDLFKRDEAWQQSRAKEAAAETVDEPTGPNPVAGRAAPSTPPRQP